MSLINKMLQDLDGRRASAFEKQGISRHARALPPMHEFPWANLLLAVTGALSGAALVMVLTMWHPGAAPNASPPPKPLSPASSPAPMPAYPALDQIRPALVPDFRPAGEVATPRPETIVAHVPQLRLDRALSLPGSDDVVEPRDRAVASDSPPRPARVEKQIRTISPSQSADAEFQRAMDLSRRGQATDAVAALRSALLLDPGHVAARQAELSLLVDQKQWDEVQRIANEGLALDPKQSGWAMLIARLQFERGETAQALATLDQHSAYAGGNAQYQAFRALLLQKSARSEESIACYRAALALQGGEGRWWYGLGLALEASHRATEARDAFAQARATGGLAADLAAAVDKKLR